MQISSLPSHARTSHLTCCLRIHRHLLQSSHIPAYPLQPESQEHAKECRATDSSIAKQHPAHNQVIDLIGDQLTEILTATDDEVNDFWFLELAK
jgi:hypothetical protein